MRNSYTLYLFDVGGTLITFDEERRAREYAKRATQVGVPVSEQDARQVLDALNREIPNRTRELKLSLLPAEEQRAFWVELWAEGFRRLGVGAQEARRMTEDLLDPANGGNFQKVFEDAQPALENLHARGKRLAVLSNFSPNCESLLSRMGLGHYFDFFIVSGILGVEKPDPRIFQAARDASGRDVRELVYIGDSVYHDYEGARAVGMDAILIDRANWYPDFDGARIRDLREL